MIKTEGRKLPGHENLRSIKGIGDLGATILLSVIGDIGNFSHPGKLAAYFGIVPRVAQHVIRHRPDRLATSRHGLAHRKANRSTARLSRKLRPV